MATRRHSSRRTEHSITATTSIFPSDGCDRVNLAVLLREVADELDPGVTDDGGQRVLEKPFGDPDAVVPDSVGISMTASPSGGVGRGQASLTVEFATSLSKNTGR